MEKQHINIVWLKRDLRTQDHLPLKLAEESHLPYLIIFVFEPSIIAHHDTSLRHLQFQYHSLKKMNLILQLYHKKIEIFYEEAIEVLQFILAKFSIINIFPSIYKYNVTNFIKNS